MLADLCAEKKTEGGTMSNYHNMVVSRTEIYGHTSDLKNGGMGS